jgi:hypothetical protein
MRHKKIEIVFELFSKLWCIFNTNIQIRIPHTNPDPDQKTQIVRIWIRNPRIGVA